MTEVDRRREVIVRNGEFFEALYEERVTVEAGGTGWAYGDSRMTIKKGGYGRAGDFARVVVEDGGICIDLGGHARAIVKKGGRFYASDDGVAWDENGKNLIEE